MLQKHFWLIWGGGWSLLTPFLLVMAWWIQQDFAEFKASALQSEAVVVGHHRSTMNRNSKTSTSDWDDYEYTTQAGQRVRVSVINTGSQPRQVIGHRAAILYHLEDPQRARLDDGSIEQVARVLRLTSLIGVTVGLIVLVCRLRARPRSPTGSALLW